MEAASQGSILSALLAQLSSLLVQLGLAVALLAMLLAQGAKLGRARAPALTGAAILVALALLTRPVYAAAQAWVYGNGSAASEASLVFTAIGTVFQVLGGTAIILLGVAIIRR
jgi:hypothetical protein